MAVLKHVRCKWASVTKPNTKFEPVYEIVALLNEEQAEKFRKMGANVQTEEDGTPYVRFKRKVLGRKRDGTTFERTPPIVVDAKKEPFEGLIGNGSLVNVQYTPREYMAFGRKGLALQLEAVQVLELVPYEERGGLEFDEEGEMKVLPPEPDLAPELDDGDIPF